MGLGKVLWYLMLPNPSPSQIHLLSCWGSYIVNYKLHKLNKSVSKLFENNFEWTSSRKSRIVKNRVWKSLARVYANFGPVVLLMPSFAPTSWSREVFCGSGKQRLTSSSYHFPFLCFRELFFLLLFLTDADWTVRVAGRSQGLNEIDKLSLKGSTSLTCVIMLDGRSVVALTTADTTGWWFSISISWFSLAHSNRVYIMAPPRFASTCSCSLDMINCLVSGELKFNKDQMSEKKENNSLCILCMYSLWLKRFTCFALYL